MVRSIRAPLLACLLIVLPGCDDPAAERAERQGLVRSMQERDRQTQEHRRQLARRVDALEQQNAQLQRLRRAETASADADARGAMLAWIATSVSLLLVLVLLIREHRIRRVLQRLVRLLLERKHGTNPMDPPVSR